jgi:hypothetical protein
VAECRIESYALHVATRKIHIELDEDLVSRARGRVAGQERSDDEVIADAVAAFVGFAALDEAHAQGGLPEDEANDLAVAEVRAHRADRGRAA